MLQPTQKMEFVRNQKTRKVGRKVMPKMVYNKYNYSHKAYDTKPVKLPYWRRSAEDLATDQVNSDNSTTLCVRAAAGTPPRVRSTLTAADLTPEMEKETTVWKLGGYVPYGPWHQSHQQSVLDYEAARMAAQNGDLVPVNLAENVAQAEQRQQDPEHPKQDAESNGMEQMLDGVDRLRDMVRKTGAITSSNDSRLIGLRLFQWTGAAQALGDAKSKIDELLAEKYAELSPEQCQEVQDWVNLMQESKACVEEKCVCHRGAGSSTISARGTALRKIHAQAGVHW